MRIFGTVATLLILVAFFSCKENSFEKQRRNELRELDNYMRTHYSDATPKQSGLYFFPEVVGVGDSIKINDRVEFFYNLMTLDSSFTTGSGPYEPASVVVTPPSQLSASAQSINTMRALHEALLHMRSDSEARIIFDSALGFGQHSTGGIPGFSPLIMDIRIYKVYPAQAPSQEE
ncbi:MAG TPA: FKBP-type peptidyl-prolyl cis-trans isomerase [Mariniphaga sp.]|nr:FKBP-type peptidyl-prolyl cis-trans isomerase [Mariniphaga sp.]